MLDELIDCIGLENINNFLESEIKIKNSLCIRVPKDKMIDIETDVFMAEEIRNMEKLEIESWFKERLGYCEKLNQKNKEVCVGGIGARAILSSIEQSVMFNYDTMVKKIEKYYEKKKERLTINDVIKASINDYMNVLNAQEAPINKRIDEILEIISKFKLKGKKVIIILEDELENYKENYNKYLTNKLFNNSAGLYTIGDNQYGRYDGFANLNDDKFLLKRVGANVEETVLYTTEEATNLMKLGRYLDNTARTINTYKVNNRFTTIELQFDPKEKKILNYEYLPCETYDELKEKPIFIEDVINMGFEDTKIRGNISNYSDLVSILDMLVGYSLSKENKADKKKKVLYVKYKKIIKNVIMKEKGNNQYFVDKEALIKNLGKLLKDIVDYNSIEKVTSSDFKYKIYNMAKIINLRVCLEDYFYEDGGIKLVETIISKSYEKILKFKDNKYIIDDDNELVFMAGQLGKYLLGKSKAAKKNKLLTSYHKATTMKKINTLLEKDMDKYGYDLNMYSRVNNIFSEILKNSKEGKLTQKERKIFLVGLYSENLIYKAIEEDVKKNKSNNNINLNVEGMGSDVKKK